MTIMTPEEAREAAPALRGLTDAGLRLLLDAAEEDILRAHGGVGPRTATWVGLAGEGFLSLPRAAESVASITAGGVAAPTTDWILADGGRTLLRTTGAWRGTVVCRYTPVPHTATRRRVQRDLALIAAGYTGLGEQSVGQVSNDPLANTEADRARALGQMPRPALVSGALPDSDTED